MPGEPYKKRVPYLYAVTYGWPGMPTTTKTVDLQRQVRVGTQILVDHHWWRVTELVESGPGVTHLGHVTALPAERGGASP